MIILHVVAFRYLLSLVSRTSPTYGRVHTSPKGIRPKVNIIALLDSNSLTKMSQSNTYSLLPRIHRMRIEFTPVVIVCKMSLLANTSQQSTQDIYYALLITVEIYGLGTALEDQNHYHIVC